MIERIDQLTAPPIVGTSYLVPLMRRHWGGHLSDWPVLLPMHSDPEFDYDSPHLQIDVRFTTPAQREIATEGCRAYLSRSDGSFERVFLSGLSRDELGLRCVAAVALAGEARMPAPVWRARICVASEFPFIDPGARVTAVLAALHPEPCAIERGGRFYCPHKGADLTTIPRRADGLVRCPMHQLLVRLPALSDAPSGPV